MTRGKGKNKQKEILTPAEKEGLLAEKKELQGILKERESFGSGTAAEQLDLQNIKREIKRIDDSIAAREAPKYRGTQKDKLVKECQELEETLKVGLPTREEMRYPVRNPGAVRKHLRWNAKNVENIKRWKFLQRVLNPDDPKNYEQLRREK